MCMGVHAFKGSILVHLRHAREQVGNLNLMCAGLQRETYVAYPVFFSLILSKGTKLRV